MAKTRITLDQIMNNEPYEIEVPPYGTILVRDPTRKDKLEARKEAMKSPYWESMDKATQDDDIAYRVAIKCVIEPEITVEQYLNAPEPKIITILDSVLLEYGKRLKSIIEKRSKIVKDFLSLMKEE